MKGDANKSGESERQMPTTLAAARGTLAAAHSQTRTHKARACQAQTTFSPGGARGHHIQQNTSSVNDSEGRRKLIRRMSDANDLQSSGTTHSRCGTHHANSLSHGERECQTRATFSRGGARGHHFQQNTSSKGEWPGAIKRVRRHQGSVVPSRVRRRVRSRQGRAGSAASRVSGGERL